VKLLIDHNLSHRLVARLADAFPDSMHVRHIGLERSGDIEIWEFARSNHLVIVSKDADFHQLSFTLGHPPKVVWIKRGNCSTREAERLIRRARAEIEAFEGDLEASFLVVE